jgi:hypothetical protein
MDIMTLIYMAYKSQTAHISEYLVTKTIFSDFFI